MSNAGLFVDGWSGTARISEDGVYRYLLTREWKDGSGTVVFVMLNPSTADGTKNDPTLRRCCAFARAWGASRLMVVNLFAFRSTDPRELVKAAKNGVDAIGPENDKTILDVSGVLDLRHIVAAWGTHALAKKRGDHVRNDLLWRSRVEALRFTKTGAPEHPLYLPGDLRPVPWEDAKP